MEKTIILRVLFVVLSVSLLSCNEEEAGQQISVENQHINHSLWSVTQAKEYFDTAQNYVLFEVSKKEKYKEGHLPNAFNIWRPDYENKEDYPYEGMMAKPSQIEQLLSKHGASPNDKILIYDTKGSVDAARFWWILKLYGHHNVHIIDGGKTAWQQKGWQLDTMIMSLPVSLNYHFKSEPYTATMASFEMVKSALFDTTTIILDTREPEEYYGQPYIAKNKLNRYKKGAYTNGNIPNAIHLNWSNAVNLKGDHCIKSIKDLKYNFEELGITPDKTIITYCQSGVRSAHTTFVLTEILGYPEVFNYDGSWIEWSYRYTQGDSIKIEQKTSKEEADIMYANLLQQ